MGSTRGHQDPKKSNKNLNLAGKNRFYQRGNEVLAAGINRSDLGFPLFVIINLEELYRILGLLTERIYAHFGKEMSDQHHSAIVGVLLSTSAVLCQCNSLIGE